MNVISQDAFAKIAVNKSLLKEYHSSNYQRVVYLNNGDEFQIQLFNPEKYVIAVKISLNGEELSDMLVIRPGERIWLERYFNQSRKFKFSTYEVEDSSEAKDAISLNGEVKIEFYRIKTSKSGLVYSSSQEYSIYPYNITSPNILDYSNVYCDSLCAQNAVNINASITTSSSKEFYSNNTIETGRVEKGGYSDQKFTYTNYDYESIPFKTEMISILPFSRKPVTSNDLHKRYCSNCGRKLSPKHKYCPYCGTKID